MPLLSLLPLLLLSAGPAAAADRYPAAREIFHCTFDEPSDRNFDRWPDGWTRRKGPGFPHYIKVEIDVPRAAEPHNLRVELDGGSAAAFSQPIGFSRLFSCVLEVLVRTEGLRDSAAMVSLAFEDEQGGPLEQQFSTRLAGTTGWTRLRLGPLSPRHLQAARVVVGLHVEAVSGAGDLKGTASFADVWLGRLPRLDLHSGGAMNLAHSGAPLELRCQASGFDGKALAVRFELCDRRGRPIADARQPLVSDGAGAWPTGESRWSPPAQPPGFYRVRATLEEGGRGLAEQQLRLAVADRLPRAAAGEFGWSLATLPPLPFDALYGIVTEAGVQRLKLPMAQSDDKPLRLEALAHLGERLAARDIELVGVLPPAERKDQAESSAADVFAADPQKWLATVEPVFARMAPLVRQWQLGTDADASFVGFPCAADAVNRAGTALGRLGQEVGVGVGWRWIDRLPPKTKGPWQFVVLSAQPALTADELADALQATASAGLARWALVEPLPAGRYSAEQRAADLARTMIVAKVHGAEGVFLSEPFRHGVLAADGTVDELFLPWRTTAAALAGSIPLGRLELPGGSENVVFARGGEAVMAVWSDAPRREVLYLGEQVRQVDLWGTPCAVERTAGGHAFTTDRLPTFVSGLNASVARWRRGFALATERLPSVFGQPHPNQLQVRNTFGQPVAGKVELVAPAGWVVEPRQIDFRLAADEELRQDFTICLPGTVNGGRHPLRVDFAVEAARPYRFSVYHFLDVGLGDIALDVRCRTNDRGELEVQQWFYNGTKQKVSFRCQLYAPGRPRQQTDVVDLPPGHDVKTYILPRAAELAGKTLWIRAEELAGPRGLNHRFVVER